MLWESGHSIAVRRPYDGAKFTVGTAEDALISLPLMLCVMFLVVLVVLV